MAAPQNVFTLIQDYWRSNVHFEPAEKFKFDAQTTIKSGFCATNILYLGIIPARKTFPVMIIAFWSMPSCGKSQKSFCPVYLRQHCKYKTNLKDQRFWRLQ